MAEAPGLERLAFARDLFGEPERTPASPRLEGLS